MEAGDLECVVWQSASQYAAAILDDLPRVTDATGTYVVIADESARNLAAMLRDPQGLLDKPNV